MNLKNYTAEQAAASDEPIYALATGAGCSAVALIRASGRGSHELIKSQLDLSTSQIEYRRLYLASLFDDGQNAVREKIDELMVAFFKGPNSYTGQDSFELHCHGSPYIIQRIFVLLEHLGFREAQPGEFTKRSFLLGKMDLTKAEGINELIKAQTKTQWLAASQLCEGQLAGKIKHLRAQLIEAMAYLEARIDFPDEGETATVELDDVKKRVLPVQSAISDLIASFENGKVALEGLRVCLIGLPNAGKSTLLNTLLSKKRAIVTDIAGTTRDYLEETCLINGRLIRLCDTAGIRESNNRVEQAGIEQSKQLAGEANLVLILYASDSDLDEHRYMKEFCTNLPKEKQIKILTKADLKIPYWKSSDMLPISCHTTEGLADLRKLIAQRVDHFTDTLNEQVVISNARHLGALTKANATLQAFFKALECGEYDECLAFELQQTASHLHSILGVIDHEDLLDKIFSDFCIGK